MILESGETRWLGMGVVFGDYGTELMPGWRKGTVEYHIDDRKIYDTQERNNGTKTIGLQSGVLINEGLVLHWKMTLASWLSP